MAHELNAHLIKFADQKAPTFLEVKDKEWIYYGEKNDYPYYLLDLYTRSSYHKDIIDTKVRYIAGSGWGYNKLGLTIEQQAICEYLLKQPFGEDNLDQIATKVTTDFELFNGFAIEVDWSNDGKKARLNHIDFANVRSNIDRTEFYYTATWFKYDRKGKRSPVKDPTENKDWTVFKPYDITNKKDKQLYYHTSFHPTQITYPLPVYSGAVIWIETNIALSDFHYNNIKGGFVPAHILNFYNGEPDVDKQRDMERKIKEKFEGEEGRRWILNFSQNKDSAPDVVTIPMSDIDKQYQEVAKECQQQIFTGHGVTTPSLFGIREEGQWQNSLRSEMMLGEELWKNSYINPRQNEINNCFNEIAHDMGISIDLKLKSTASISWFPDDPTIAAVLSKDEMRTIILGKIGSQLGITSQQFSAKDQSKEVDFSLFETFGFSKDGWETVQERDLDKFEFSDVMESESELIKMCFGAAIPQLDKTILDLISKDTLITPEVLAKAAKSSVPDIMQAIGRLKDNNLISETAGGLAITSDAQKILAQSPAKTDDYRIVYSYELANNSPELVPGGHSRPFCKKMMDLNRYYSREDIETISEREDRNVWLMRGGWYHNPKKDVNVPHCRHIWKQKLVKQS